MAGRGRAPKEPGERMNPRAKPAHEWKPSPGVGWQHGTLPEPPAGLMPASIEAWETWLKSWFAANWTPADLPGLRQVIRVHDQVERGDFVRAGELRLQMDTYGITPKGQQDRRWKPPAADEPSKPASGPRGARYGHLRAVGD